MGAVENIKKLEFFFIGYMSTPPPTEGYRVLPPALILLYCFSPHGQIVNGQILRTPCLVELTGLGLGLSGLDDVTGSNKVSAYASACCRVLDAGRQ